MTLKFWLGGADSDKSRELAKYILKEADEHPDIQYLYVVPEQYSLATQQELVFNSKNKGILNIDVLSFTRLAHRISDEVGSYYADVTTLDDPGKSLLIGMLAQQNRKNLTVFADNLEKPGYTDKIKSIISEFMQYGITVEKSFEMADCAKKAGYGLLASKLSDIAIIYKAFKDYIKDRYTTTEETLDVVSTIVPHSDTIKNSVIVFDGFTGFTPVQNKLISVLMDHAKGIHVALLLETPQECIQEEKTTPTIREHELFYLSKRTMAQLGQLADEKRIVTEELYIRGKNGINNACNDINNDVYKDTEDNAKLNNTHVHIFTGQDPDEEIQMVFSKIMELIRTKKYRYKDIAILTGEMESYRHPIERELSRHDIPFFIDATEPILLNPFIEYIRSFIDIISDNYSQTSVFRFLKSGLTGIDNDKICTLENYCLAANIKGYKKWHERFTVNTSVFGAEELEGLNAVREEFIKKFDLFEKSLAGARKEDGDRHINAASTFSAFQFAAALYNVIEYDAIEDKLKETSKRYEDSGDRKMTQICGKIYPKIMDILDELCELVPDEKTDIRGFGNLLDNGLDNIRIGILPTGMDYIQVGDLTRSRIGDVKALFIVGANDGIIPKTDKGGGLINDNERRFLTDMDDKLVLAPDGREDIYTQQLYIYMAMKKPSEHLFVSYPRLSASGKSLLPSYIIKKIKSEHPEVRIETKPDLTEYYADELQAFDELTDLLYPALSGDLDTKKAKRVRDLLVHFLGEDGYKDRLLKMIKKQILTRGAEEDDTIGAALAQAIYGKRIVTNITKLENYANCAYRYFLEHGCRLREREIFSFEARDVGNIFHDSMKIYSQMMQKGGKDWTSVAKEEQESLMDAAVDKVMERYRDEKLSSSARYAYMETRIRKIMRKSADIVSAQLRAGKFEPKYFEVDFDKLEAGDTLSIRLSDDEMLRLRGRIDRIDTYESDDGIYIKIVDYKSSRHKMDLAAVYEGRQLQLLVYLNAATEGIKSQKTGEDHKVIPAGILYYLIDDPMISTDKELTDDDIHKLSMKDLSLNGLVNSDMSVLELIDKDIKTDPTVLPLSVTSKGVLKKNDQAVSEDDFAVLSEYVGKCIRRMGEEMLSGNIEIPVPDGEKRFTAPNCTYCPYTGICANKGKPAAEDAVEAGAGNDAWIELMRKQCEEPKNDEDNA